MPTIVSRAHQAFPVLDQAQIVRARGFAVGEGRRFSPAEVIYRTGDKNVAAWLVLEGEIELSRRDGLGPDAPISSVASGQFTGEVGQLSGRPALVSAQAGPNGCVALPFDAAHLRALVIGSAEIGEIVMRALILRRAITAHPSPVTVSDRPGPVIQADREILSKPVTAQVSLGTRDHL